MSLAGAMAAIALVAIVGAFGYLFSALCAMREDVDRWRQETTDWLVELDQRVQELEREREAKQP